jgi:hypothetical protein
LTDVLLEGINLEPLCFSPSLELRQDQRVAHVLEVTKRVSRVLRNALQAQLLKARLTKEHQGLRRVLLARHLHSQIIIIKCT